ncbi:MAG: hypothetical protein ACE5RJ_01110 [Nitrosopumilaceae archaeon]
MHKYSKKIQIVAIARCDCGQSSICDTVLKYQKSNYLITMLSGRFVSNASFHVSQRSTLMPRLEYSVQLLEEILNRLKEKKSELTKANRFYIPTTSKLENSELKQVELEKIFFFAVESLSRIHKRLESLSGIFSIPIILPSTIPVIRAISSKLYEAMPQSSQSLCELSSVLGSVLIDSGTITEAKFDFRASNQESNILLDKAKLIVDSKLSKQYPNLDFFKANNA